MRIIELQQDNSIDYTIKVGICLSVIFHILFVFFIINSPNSSSHIQQSLEVSIIPELVPAINDKQTQETTQIVDTPQNQESPEDNEADTNLLSEKNFRTEKEQIKRGDRPDAGNVAAKSQTAQKPAQQNEPQKKAPQEKQAKPAPAKLNTLRLDDQTLLEKFVLSKPAKNSQAEATSSYQAFSRPAGSGAAFIGLSGSNDHLPNLPDGDITLLNTKADKFAVFVRRVASLVFSHMRNTGWETLSASDINRISDFSTVRAILDPKGNLIKIIIESSSGSTRFDASLKSAVNSGAHDPNPPKAALAEDGNYHFIFKSKSWSRTGNAPKTGAPYERRWLLLATGLL